MQAADGADVARDARAGRGGAALGDLLRLGRPHFLIAGLAFLALGIALALRAGASLDPASLALAAAIVVGAQWGVHYGNEAHDVAADRANAARTRLAGGTGLIASGRATVREARVLAGALFALAGAAALALAVQVPSSAAVSAPLLLLSWGYSAPPLRLTSRGVGELATGVVVAGLVPALPLVSAGVPVAQWWPLLPLMLQVAACVVVLSLPDVPGDAATGKRTFAVRLGAGRTRRALQVAWLACGLASTLAVARGAPPAFALTGGAAFAATVALPVLVLRRSWDALAGLAIALAALQWALTLAWALA